MIAGARWSFGACGTCASDPAPRPSGTGRAPGGPALKRRLAWSLRPEGAAAASSLPSVALWATAAPHGVRLAAPRATRGSFRKPARAYPFDVGLRDAQPKPPLPTVPLRSTAGPAWLLWQGQPFGTTRAYRGAGASPPNRCRPLGRPVPSARCCAPCSAHHAVGSPRPAAVGCRGCGWTPGPASRSPNPRRASREAQQDPSPAREPARAIHTRSRCGRELGAMEFARRVADRRSRPWQWMLEQATLAAEDHDTSERRHHHCHSEENPNCHDLYPARAAGRIVTFVEALPRAASGLLDERGRAMVRRAPASRPERTLIGFGLEAGHDRLQSLGVSTAQWSMSGRSSRPVAMVLAWVNLRWKSPQNLGHFDLEINRKGLAWRFVSSMEI